MLKPINRWVLLVGIVSLFFLSRLISLVKLPVFADEAIYIRWAQIIRHEPQKYLFLPMYDGKPPLHMWLLNLFLPITPLDPLYSARLMSVVFGFLTLITLSLIIKRLQFNLKAITLTLLLYIFCPFTFFHDRMAMIDTMLTFFLSLTFLFLLLTKQTQQAIWAVLAGISWGLSLWSKLPAIFFAPMFAAIAIMPRSWVFPHKLTLAHKKYNRYLSLWWIQTFCIIAVAGIIGIAMLFSFKSSPWFPFLFTRGRDFSYTIPEIINSWYRIIPINIYRFSQWLVWYIPFPWLLSIALVIPTIAKKHQKILLILLLFSLMFVSPFIITGKVVAARYLLPTIIFILPSISISLILLYRFNKILGISLFTLGLLQSLYFAYPSYTDVAKIPFTHDDTEQYLTQWSAGFGNLEVRNFIKKEAQNQPITVATEGYFGTLPDGLLMYFDRDPVIKNLEIFGVGQPITGINPKIIERSKSTPTYLVVNENRFEKGLYPQFDLIAVYPRPHNGPALLLLKYPKSI